MSRIPRAALAVLATGALFLGACSSDDAAAPANDGTRTETTSQAPEVPGIGDRVEVKGLALTIDEVSEATEIDWYEHDDDHPGGTREARDDGKFVLVRTTVENASNKDIQPSCYDVDVNLHGDNDAEYGPLTDTPLYPENVGCSDYLGSGFDEEVTYVFEIPSKVTPVGFDFALTEGPAPSREKGEIAIAEVEKESDSDRPNPTSDATAERTTDRTTTRTITTQQAATAPAYGAPCAASQASQPGTAADGTPLVCVGMGNGGFSWVYGPSPQGAGTASDGGVCTEGESGGQDEQGRMMMCVNGEWVYGP